jgi:hypothetical protein
VSWFCFQFQSARSQLSAEMVGYTVPTLSVPPYCGVSGAIARQALKPIFFFRSWSIQIRA